MVQFYSQPINFSDLANRFRTALLLAVDGISASVSFLHISTGRVLNVHAFSAICKYEFSVYNFQEVVFRGVLKILPLTPSPFGEGWSEAVKMQFLVLSFIQNK